MHHAAESRRLASARLELHTARLFCLVSAFERLGIKVLAMALE